MPLIEEYDAVFFEWVLSLYSSRENSTDVLPGLEEAIKRFFPEAA